MGSGMRDTAKFKKYLSQVDAILFDNMGSGMRDAAKFKDSPQMLSVSLLVASMCYRQVKPKIEEEDITVRPKIGPGGFKGY
jgi:hypothetical protein